MFRKDLLEKSMVTSAMSKDCAIPQGRENRGFFPRCLPSLSQKGHPRFIRCAVSAKPYSP
jgi:hypothetical protein